MNKKLKCIASIFGWMVSCGVMADVNITSPNGSKIIFSQKKEGENIDQYAWSKVFFVHENQKIDLSRDDRYYTEDGSTKVSPTGTYLKITSISGDYVALGNGEKKYTDRAYCSIIDMRNGCVVSDWDGEACAYDWAKDSDLLSEEPDGHGDKFDFQSLRPNIKKAVNPFSNYSPYEVRNLLRCDAPSVKNINIYQKLLRENVASKENVSSEIVSYLKSLKTTLVMSSKTTLYASPDDGAKTNGYLISGDKVTVIQISSDNKWVNIGYINGKNTPLIAWIKR